MQFIGIHDCSAHRFSSKISTKLVTTSELEQANVLPKLAHAKGGVTLLMQAFEDPLALAVCYQRQIVLILPSTLTVLRNFMLTVAGNVVTQDSVHQNDLVLQFIEFLET